MPAVLVEQLSFEIANAFSTIISNFEFTHGVFFSSEAMIGFHTSFQNILTEYPFSDVLPIDKNSTLRREISIWLLVNMKELMII